MQLKVCQTAVNHIRGQLEYLSIENVSQNVSIPNSSHNSLETLNRHFKWLARVVFHTIL